MLRHLIVRPIGVLMTTTAVIAISVVFINRLSISLLPDIPIPSITVQISAPNLDARTLENTVTKVIRNQLLQVSDLRDIESRTRNGSAILELRLEYGVHTSLSYIEINEKLDQVMAFLPREIERPRVIQSNISDIPISYLNLSVRDRSLTNHLEFSEFSKRVIRRRLEQLEDVAFVDIHGLSSPEIVIQPKKDLMVALGITQSQLSSAIQQSNVELGNILLKDRQYEYNVRLDNRLATIDDIRNIILNVNNIPYHLTQIADIKLTHEQERGSFYINAKKGISLAIRKKASANIFALQKQLDELVDAFTKDYPNVEFTVSNDQSSILTSSFSSLRTSLWYGLGFAGLILFFFFKDWRVPLLIIITVPISLMASMFLFYLIGLSINIVSLTGLILGIGLMIDNSIIITESIKRNHLHRSLYEACHHGANEVIRPLVSSALTTSSVFLPLILLSGLAGALFYDQAISISISLGVSLLVSYYLLPVISNLMLSNKKSKLESEVQGKESFHHTIIRSVIRWRWAVLLLYLLGLGLTYFLFINVEKQAFPSITRTDYQIKIDWNEAIPLTENEKRARDIHTLLENDIAESNSYLGETQFLIMEEDQHVNEADIWIYLSSADDDGTLDYITRALQEKYPRSVVAIDPLPNAFDRIFGQAPVDAYAHIQGISAESMISPDELNVLLSTPNFASWKTSVPPTDTYIEIKILYDKLLLYDVSYDALLTRLKSAFRANVITQLKSNDAFIPIQLGNLQTEDISDILRSQTVTTNSGSQLTLDNFIKTSYTGDYKEITAGRSGERVSLPIENYNDSLVENILNTIKESGQYLVSFSGPYFENQELLQELLVIGLLVIALLFLILAAQFESLFQPFIIAMTLPIGTMGALLSLYLAGESLNIMSVVGIIILSGIDVNDAILKVDMFNRCRVDGLPLIKAITEGSGRRLRAIIMTSLTTGLAMLPILFASGLGAELQRPLAIALIGGLLFGTVASIVLIPVFYYLLYRK